MISDDIYSSDSSNTVSSGKNSNDDSNSIGEGEEDEQDELLESNDESERWRVIQ